jgi:hypothetical protein
MTDFKQLGRDIGHMLGTVAMTHDRVSPTQQLETLEGMREAFEQQAPSDVGSPGDLRVEDAMAYLRFAKVFMTRTVSDTSARVFMVGGSTIILMLDDHTLHTADRVLCQAAVEGEATLAAAAAVLGISRHALKRRCVKYGLAMPSR